MKKIEKMDSYEEIVKQTKASEEDYEKARKEYLAKKRYYNPGGFLSMGRHESDPIKAQAEWDSTYPRGYDSWFNEKGNLTLTGVASLFGRINELIDAVEELQKK